MGRMACDDTDVLANPTAPAAPESNYPLSALQESMLYRYVLDTGSRSDIEQAVLRLDSRIDVARLDRAWRTVAAHHPALRAGFRWTGTVRPLHTIAANAGAIQVEDAGAVSLAAREHLITTRAQTERERGFDLAAPPLHRLVLLRFGQTGAALIWTNHHAVLDGRARAVVLHDLIRAYDGKALEPAAAFSEHIARLERFDVRSSEAFWRARLRDFVPHELVPFARRTTARGSIDPGAGAVSRTMTAEQAAVLNAFAYEHGVTLTTLAHAAWAIVLARYAASNDIVFGAVRACRSPGRDKRSVGLYINTLPMRIRIDADAPLGAWLREVRDAWTDLRAVEQTPLPLVQSWSSLPAGTPLFESAVMVERERFCDVATRIDANGTLGIYDAGMHGQTSLPLVLSLTGTATIDLRLQYDADRFSSLSMARLLERFEIALLSLAAPATQRTGDISLMAHGEERAIERFNHTTPYPRDKTIHMLFMDCARCTPDAVAVQIGDATMTYRELDERSDRIAAYLCAHGIGRGSFAGLCAERSFDMIAALLGILKSGAASIALDPAHPPHRLRAMLAEANVNLILVTPGCAGSFGVVPCAVIGDLLATPRVSSAPGVPGKSGDAAHVMYTSGSTGAPKGAVIPHRAVLRTVCGADYLRFASDETLFGFVPLTFDVSILEIWGALLNGARLVLCPPGLPSLDELGAMIAAQSVTTLWLTSALFEQMIATQIDKLRGVRQLIVGGDVMSPDFARRALAGLPKTRILNVYGPTEATVLITAQPLAEPLPVPIPIGQPIANATVYILDARCRRVAIGVPGEIYTGGDGLAIGYINQPERTAECFVPDPFSDEPGAMMYRTGDLGRWRSGGEVEFLGRIDTQVKLRGIRVEPGEADAVLVRHPGVEQSVTTVRTINGAKQLVSYITRGGAALVDAPALHALAATELPDVMRPAAFVFLAEMPLTATGKIDRSALPPPPANVESDVVPAAPHGAVELTIAAQMAGLLQVDRVSRDDDFYAFGGDSLLAMRFVAQLRETFGVDLTVNALTRGPTVAHLARAIAILERAPCTAAGTGISTLRAGGSKAPVFYFHGDLTGGGRYCHAIADRIDGERAVHVIDVSDLAGTADAPNIEAVARESVAAIRELCPQGPYVLGGFCAGGLVAFETARLLERSGDVVENVLIIDGFARNAGLAPLADFAGAGAIAARVRAVRRDGFARAAEMAASLLGRLRGIARHPDAAAATWDAWHEERLERWERVTARYIPRSYSGTVTLLWSDESVGEGRQVMRQWLRVARHALPAYVPGTHLTSITHHLQVTARIFAHCIDPVHLAPQRRTSQ